MIAHYAENAVRNIEIRRHKRMKQIILFMVLFLVGCNKIENIDTTNDLLVYEITDEFEPCACCGEICQGLDCDWENRYQIDSPNCELNITNLTLVPRSLISN